MSLVKLRRFETKLGERLEVLSDSSDVAGSVKGLRARYVIFGIPEDIGVQANLGIAGTTTAWLSFLQSFLNIQSSDFIEADQVALIGPFVFGDNQYLNASKAFTEE